MFNNYNYYTLPVALDSILNSNVGAMDYYASLDASARKELIHYANDFASKEELERFLYYAMKDNYKNEIN
jgi:hypothetical protein